MIRVLDRVCKPGDCVLAFGIPTNSADFYKDLKTKNKDFAKRIGGGWHQYEFQVIGAIKKVEPIMKKLGVTIIHNLTLKDFGNLFKEYKDKVIILFTHWQVKTNRAYFEKQEYLSFLEKHPDFLEYVEHSAGLLEWLINNSDHLKSLAKTKLSGQKKQENGKEPLVKIEEEKIDADYDEIVHRYLKEISLEAYLGLLKHSITGRVEFHDGLKRLYDIVRQIPVNYHGFLDLNVCRSRDLTTALKKCRPDCHFKYKIEPLDKEEKKGVKPDVKLYFYLALFKYLQCRELSYLDAFKIVSLGFLNQVGKLRRKLERTKENV